jgi:hypothetical protein
MQIDDLMSTDTADNLLYISGNAIRSDRLYRVALIHKVLTGMDSIVPILGLYVLLLIIDSVHSLEFQRLRQCAFR